MICQPGKLWLAADAWCLAQNSTYAKAGWNSVYLKCGQFVHCLISAENMSYKEDVDRICNNLGARSLLFTFGTRDASFAVS